MSRHVIAAAFILALAGSVGHAREGRAQTPPPAEKPAADQNRPAPAPQGLPVNVKIDLTITDQLGPGEPAKKTISIIVADRAVGSIRSTGNASVGGNRSIINIDANPQILQNGNLKVSLGLEYNPRQTPTTRPVLKSDTGATVEVPTEGGSSLNQRVVVVLEPGKPLVMSQAADPISDRKITVEIRATVLK